MGRKRDRKRRRPPERPIPPANEVAQEDPRESETMGCGGAFLMCVTLLVLVGFSAEPVSTWRDFWRSAHWLEAPIVSATGGRVPSKHCGPRCTVPGWNTCDFTYSWLGRRHSATQEYVSGDQETACAYRTVALVNPTDPEDAIVFRDPTSGMYTMLVLASALWGVFLAITLHAWRSSHRAWAVQASAFEHPKEPWRWQTTWRERQVASAPDGGSAWVMAIAFAPGPATAIAACALDGRAPPGWGYPALVVALLSLALTLTLTVGAWVRRTLAGVTGVAVLVLPHDVPLRPGEHVRVDIVLRPGLRSRSSLPGRYALRCTKVEPKGRGSQWSTLHERSAPTTFRLDERGLRASVELTLPAGLTRSTTRWTKTRWWLVVDAPAAGPIARFDLPVYDVPPVVAVAPPPEPPPQEPPRAGDTPFRGRGPA